MSGSGTIQFQIRLPYELHQEGDWIIASCYALDVHSQGRDQKEAMDNLTEAIQLFVESCYERGSLEQVLKAQGFRPAHGKQRHVKADYLDVPLELVAENNAEAATC